MIYHFNNKNFKKINKNKKKIIYVVFYKITKLHNPEIINKNKSNKILYYTSSFIENIIASKAILNKNTIKFFEIQDLDRYLNLLQNNHREINIKMKKLIDKLVFNYHNKLDLKMQEQKVFVSGFVTFILGVENLQI